MACVTLARLLVHALAGGLTLVEDEAHYWEWSRHLDWSYYSKGPGVAWVIWLSTQLLGDTEIGVRAPAAFFSAASAIAAAALTRLITPRSRTAMLTAAAAMLAMPGAQISGFVMTIDGPLLAFWMAATLLGWMGLRVSRKPAAAWIWPAMGAAVALGFIFKYTMALLPLGLVAYFLVRRGKTRPVRGRALFAGLAVALLGLVPVVIWNAGHDWATVRHLLGHLGAPGGDTRTIASVEPEPWSVLDAAVSLAEYAGLTLAAGGPPVVLAVLGLINLHRHPRAAGAPAARHGAPAYLLCMGAPVLLLYVLVSLVTRVEANWAMAGLVTLAPIAGWAAAEGWARRDHGVGAATVAVWVTLVGGTLLPVFVSVAAIAGASVPGVPMGRVSGVRVLAASATEQVERLRERTGLEPFVMTTHYGRASLLAFYMDDHPVTYAASAHLGGGRKSQYDVWPETDLSRADTTADLWGRPALLFNGELADWELVFDSVELIDQLPGEHKPNRPHYLGLGFRGFTPQMLGPDPAEVQAILKERGR